MEQFVVKIMELLNDKNDENQECRVVKLNSYDRITIPESIHKNSRLLGNFYNREELCPISEEQIDGCTVVLEKDIKNRPDLYVAILVEDNKVKKGEIK